MEIAVFNFAGHNTAIRHSQEAIMRLNKVLAHREAIKKRITFLDRKVDKLVEKMQRIRKK